MTRKTGKSWKLGIHPDPLTGKGGDGMILLPQEVLQFYGWSEGDSLRLEVEETGLRLMRWHNRKGE